MKPLRIAFFLMLSCMTVYAEDILTDFTPESLPILNEELRQLHEKNRQAVNRLDAIEDNSDSTTLSVSADHTASGLKTSITAAQTTNFGDVCYINSSGKAALIDADAIATMSAIVICADSSIASDASGNWLLVGIVRDDTWNWTAGGLIYGTVTATTGNTLSQTAPTATDDVVQIIGVALSADKIYFNPSLSQVELT